MRFETPRAIISDEGSHVCSQAFETLLAKYRVKHKIDIAYHPQTSRQTKILNREIKREDS